MKDYSYDLWTLTELPGNDPRLYLEIIVSNAKFGKIQAIQYKGDTVFIIAEKQYRKLINI